MVATGFDALNEAELALEGMQLISTEMRTARVRMGTLRAINSAARDDAAPAGAAARDLRADQRGDRPDRGPPAPTTSSYFERIY